MSTGTGDSICFRSSPSFPFYEIHGVSGGPLYPFPFDSTFVCNTLQLKGSRHGQRPPGHVRLQNNRPRASQYFSPM